MVPDADKISFSVRAFKHRTVAEPLPYYAGKLELIDIIPLQRRTVVLFALSVILHDDRSERDHVSPAGL